MSESGQWPCISQVSRTVKNTVLVIETVDRQRHSRTGRISLTTTSRWRLRSAPSTGGVVRQPRRGPGAWWIPDAGVDGHPGLPSGCAAPGYETCNLMVTVKRTTGNCDTRRWTPASAIFSTSHRPARVQGPRRNTPPCSRCAASTWAGRPPQSCGGMVEDATRKPSASADADASGARRELPRRGIPEIRSHGAYSHCSPGRGHGPGLHETRTRRDRFTKPARSPLRSEHRKPASLQGHAWVRGASIPASARHHQGRRPSICAWGRDRPRPSRK